MTDNPSSDNPFAPTPPAEQPLEPRAEPGDFVQPESFARSRRFRNWRPMGISILSVLYVMAGIRVLATMITTFTNQTNGAQGALRESGVAPTLFAVSTGFSCVIALASGTGMWLGKRWGWWIGAFYCLFGIVQTAAGAIGALAKVGELTGISTDQAVYLVLLAGLALIQLLILLYFFKGSVLTFFHLGTLNVPLALAILIGLNIALPLALLGVNMLLARN